MRFLMITYKGDGTSWGKLSVIASLIWFLFFKQRFPFSHILALFQDNFILVEATSHFLRVTTSTQQLVFRGSYLFRTAAVFSFFRTVTFSQELFLESCLFIVTTFSRDATFHSSYLLRRATLLQHTFSEELLFHSYASFPQLHFLFIRQQLSKLSTS